MGFYSHFRWLAFVGKISGLFPVQNVLSKDVTKLRYEEISFISMFSVAAYFSIIYVQYASHGFQYNIESPYHQLLQTLVVFIFIRSIFSFLFCLHRHAKQAIQLIKLLESFHKYREEIFTERCHSPAFHKWIGTVLPIVTHVLLANFYLVESFQLIQKIHRWPNFWAAWFFGCISIWHLVPPLYYTCLASTISIGFQQINHAIINRGFSTDYISDAVKFEDDMGETLSVLRLLHNLLSEATAALSKCYGGFLAVNNLFLVVAVVVNLSAYFCTVNDSNLISLTCIDFFYFVVLTGISNQIKNRGAKVARLFQGIPTSALSEKSKEEIHLWLLQLSVHPVQVNAAGYFILDKSQSFEVLSSIATYLIVAVQLLQEEKSSVATT